MARVQALEGIKDISREEAMAIFEAQVQKYLQMDAAAFLSAWQSGTYRGREDEPPVSHVVKLLPLIGVPV